MATVSCTARLLVLLLLGARARILCSAFQENGSKEDDLLQRGGYYIMHQDETRVTLKIKLDGSIEWKYGSPTLYSVFHQQMIHEKGSGERMYALEAIATQHWICMNGKGRLYTIKKLPLFQLKGSGGRRDEWGKIRHPRKKDERGRRRRPLSDCFFKTYEFSPDESYEAAVGIYSYAHSNRTHGRFLAINPVTGKARTYRKAFINLSKHSQIKIRQIPIRYLTEMVNSTKFEKSNFYNRKVRQCILQLISCPNHREKIRQGRRRSRKKHHFYRIIERCKNRAVVTPSLPQCTSKRTQDSGPS